MPASAFHELSFQTEGREFGSLSLQPLLIVRLGGSLLPLSLLLSLLRCEIYSTQSAIA